MANNGPGIPLKTLNDLCEIIAAQHDLICEKWKEFFVTDAVTYYC